MSWKQCTTAFLQEAIVYDARAGCRISAMRAPANPEELIMMQQHDEKKYSWSTKDGKVHCCTSETSTCTVSKFWELRDLTSFHDAQLQQATKEINAILEDLRKRNRDSERDLSFIQIRDRHFLVWAHHGLIGPADDHHTVRRKLRIKTR